MSTTVGKARHPPRGAKLLALLAIPAAALLSACAVGIPKSTTGVTLTGATLNGNVYSNFDGNTDYWWRWGGSPGYGHETPHRTLAIHDEGAHPVSEPLSGLTENTTYHFQLCVKDAQARPERICSKDQTFSTGSTIEGSKIAFVADFRNVNPEIYVMNTDGSDQTNLTNDSLSTDFDPAWSPDGSKIAFRSDRDSTPEDHRAEVYVMDADGANRVRLTTAGGAEPTWSPDGNKIAFTTYRDGSSEVYVMDADGSDQTRITDNPASDLEAAWSPDGSKIAFTSTRDGNFEVYVMDADGSNPTRLTNSPGFDWEPAWSPDGSKIAFGATSPDNWDVYVMDADGRNRTRLTDDPMVDSEPAWSPDGSKIAFSTDRDAYPSPYLDVYVMDADGSDQVNLTNNDAPDSQPAWSPVP